MQPCLPFLGMDEDGLSQFRLQLICILMPTFWAVEYKWEWCGPTPKVSCSILHYLSSPARMSRLPWRRERLPTPVFWPGEFRGLYSPWGHKESDTTERLSLSLSRNDHGENRFKMAEPQDGRSLDTQITAWKRVALSSVDISGKGFFMLKY